MLYIEDFLKYLELERNYSYNTITTYREDLALFAKYLKEQGKEENLLCLKSEDIRLWVMDSMEQGLKASSVCRRLSTLRSFFKFLLINKIIEADPTRRIQGPKKERPLPSFVRENEMDRLMDVVCSQNSFCDMRDRLIVETFYETGIRLSELIGINVEDVHFDARYIKVTGKRNKQRIVPFGEEMNQDIQNYLKERDKQTEIVSKALFLTKKGERMSPQQVRLCVKKLLSLVSTQKKRSPHVLRHTFATSMLNHDANLEVVKEILGHESLSTTEIYTHTTFEELKKVYNHTHPRALKKGGNYGT